MSYWPVRPMTADVRYNLTQVAGMLSRVGTLGVHDIAAELLHALAADVPVAQCTIFAYDGVAPPRIVSFADRARTRQLSDISQSYAWRFYTLDGNRQVMAAETAHAQHASRIFVHHQAGRDITDADYRTLCYELPKISERLALLAMFDGKRWISLNFYRAREYGAFSTHDIDRLEAMAPLLMQIVRLHYQTHVYQNELADVLADRVMNWNPDLTPRERELLQRTVRGEVPDAMARAMGIQLGSLQTSVKRLHRKLGVSSHRELMALAVQPGPASHQA